MRAISSRGMGWSAVGFVLLSSACTGGSEKGGQVDTGAEHDSGQDEPADPLSWDRSESGPYQVGYRSWDVTTVPADGLEERTVRINVWYPTEDTSGDMAFYTVGTDASSFLDASLAPSPYAEGYPVHLHSHGSQGYGATSSFLARHFASHGWVFLAPDHTDNTLVDNVDPRPSEHYVERPLDLGTALDALEDDSELGGLANTDTVLLSGHSYGVYTSWAAIGASFDLEGIQERCDNGELGGGTCHEALMSTLEAGVSDERIVAALPMAGSASSSWFGETGIQAVDVPVMLLAGSEDDVGQAEEWERTEGMDYAWAELDGGCHQTFALGSCATLDVELGFRIVRTYAMAFGRFRILGDTAQEPLLTGEEAAFEEVLVRSR